MVRHIVMWTLKENALGADKAANAQSMKAKLERLNGRIDGLKRLEVSCSVLVADPECDVVLVSEHEDRAGLNAYANHPEHQACVAFIKEVAATRRVVDYEI